MTLPKVQHHYFATRQLPAPSMQENLWQAPSGGSPKNVKIELSTPMPRCQSHMHTKQAAFLNETNGEVPLTAVVHCCSRTKFRQAERYHQWYVGKVPKNFQNTNRSGSLFLSKLSITSSAGLDRLIFHTHQGGLGKPTNPSKANVP